jgi:hypothetical protein
MKTGEFLKQVTIPSPCRENWDSMTGDNRTRFCQNCGKSAFNLAAMTHDEAASLVAEQGHDLCAQVTRRKDGSVVTAKLPPSKLRFGIRSLMIAIAGVAAALGFFKFLIESTSVVAGKVCLPPPPAPASAPSADLVDDLANDPNEEGQTRSPG